MLDYKKEYERWKKTDMPDFDLTRELQLMDGKEEEIKEHFARALEFGTAGIRGTLGAGTNRMNIFVVRQTTEGLARYILEEGLEKKVAISYDSRLKGWTFAKEVSGVLAANGISVRLYDALMPVPALSFATRYYGCSAGIMLTASHNPAIYNGYKVYGSDGCQMTDGGQGLRKNQEYGCSDRGKADVFFRGGSRRFDSICRGRMQGSLLSGRFVSAGSSGTLQGSGTFLSIHSLEWHRAGACYAYFQRNGDNGREHCAGAGIP